MFQESKDLVGHLSSFRTQSLTLELEPPGPLGFLQWLSLTVLQGYLLLQLLRAHDLSYPGEEVHTVYLGGGSCFCLFLRQHCGYPRLFTFDEGVRVTLCQSCVSTLHVLAV